MTVFFDIEINIWNYIFLKQSEDHINVIEFYIRI